MQRISTKVYFETQPINVDLREYERYGAQGPAQAAYSYISLLHGTVALMS